jgi:hypothetical protein
LGSEAREKTREAVAVVRSVMTAARRVDFIVFVEKARDG